MDATPSSLGEQDEQEPAKASAPVKESPKAETVNEYTLPSGTLRRDN